MTIADENEAFESAVARLPHPVFVVDGQSRLRAMNGPAKQLWKDHGMDETQIHRRPSQPLSIVILAIRAGELDDDESTILELSGSRFEVIHSTRSPRGEGRWLMLMLRPFPTVAAVDHNALRKRWSLTPREAEIAAACIAGRTSSEMCESFSITRETLRTHIKRLLSKAECGSRSQLIAKYLFGE